jgi:palmitoyltransferase
MPVNYVMLAVVSGIIGLVLAGFTGWHIILASRGQTTTECLEKTRYLSPLRKSMQYHPIQPYADQMENGQRHESYDAMERQRARDRYEAYLDEQDSEKLPSTFDLGWKRNLRHLFGPKPALWFLPICTTTGDGWSWEPSPKCLEARERIAREGEEQRSRDSAAGWGAEPTLPVPQPKEGAGRHYVAYPSRSTSKADKILGRNPDGYADTGAVSMENLRPRHNDDYDSSSDEDEAERRALGRKATVGWPQKVGVVTNTVLGNTLLKYMIWNRDNEAPKKY